MRSDLNQISCLSVSQSLLLSLNKIYNVFLLCVISLKYDEILNNIYIIQHAEFLNMIRASRCNHEYPDVYGWISEWCMHIYVIYNIVILVIYLCMFFLFLFFVILYVYSLYNLIEMSSTNWYEDATELVTNSLKK